MSQIDKGVLAANDTLDDAVVVSTLHIEHCQHHDVAPAIMDMYGLDIKLEMRRWLRWIRHQLLDPLLADRAPHRLAVEQFVLRHQSVHLLLVDSKIVITPKPLCDRDVANINKLPFQFRNDHGRKLFFCPNSAGDIQRR